MVAEDQSRRNRRDGSPDEGTVEAGASGTGGDGRGDDAFERGVRKRREVLGDAHVERADANRTRFDEDFQEFITRYAWGEVWQRDGIDERTRHLIVLAMMAALGRDEEFAMHVRATRNTGVSEGELAEALHLVAIYAGLPLANGAFKTAKRVLAKDTEERGRE